MSISSFLPSVSQSALHCARNKAKPAGHSSSADASLIFLSLHVLVMCIHTLKTKISELLSKSKDEENIGHSRAAALLLLVLTAQMGYPQIYHIQALPERA